MPRRSGRRSHPALLLIVPLIVLTIPGLVFSRTLVGSGKARLASSSAKGAQAPVVTATTAPTPSATGPMPSLGRAAGTIPLHGPAEATSGFVVFVVDGAHRVLRTDSRAPFSARLNTRDLPNGGYTVTVLWTRKGMTSVTSTSTLTIANPEPGATPTSSATSTPTPTATPSSGTGNSDTLGAQVLVLTNAARVSAGCAQLTVSLILARVAQAHSADMAAHNYFAHNSQDGRTPFDRMRAAGYSFSTAGENIAQGQQTAAAVMDAWMGSAGHKANILNCSYTQVGIGYAVGTAGAYWTQDFGRPA